jgi:hypothetical protein
MMYISDKQWFSLVSEDEIKDNFRDIQERYSVNSRT